MKIDSPASSHPVKVAVVGLGNMGANHVKTIQSGELPGLRLVAVCDSSPFRLASYKQIPTYSSAERLIEDKLVDALIIATPHYAHTTVGMAALQAGYHVLVEKPISVHKADCERLIAAHTDPNQVFVAMFNQRALPCYRRIKQMLVNNELGELQRIHWTATDWFRTDLYYRQSDWRATWSGEGGGVLLNQCPHQLDLLQWLFGMPKRVWAKCRFGLHHPITVEDEVTAFLEFENGASATFVTSTGETPGTDRLEIIGDNGKLVLEKGRLTFTKNLENARSFMKTSDNPFGKPDTETFEIVLPATGNAHKTILQNFHAAIRNGEKPIAPAAEGIHSVELANAMLLSTWQNRTIDLPIDSESYVAELNKRIEQENTD